MSKQSLTGLMVMFALCASCMGGQLASMTPEQALAKAERDAQELAWSEARAGAIKFLVERCMPAPSDLAACTRAELTRGNAELALGAPEAAFLAFSWVAQQGSPESRDEAQRRASQAAEDMKRLLARTPGQSLLVIEHDFADDARFAPERMDYTLDGQPLGSVLSRTTLRERRHRALAKAIGSGAHELGVEVHWKGEGTFSDYVWRAYYSLKLEAPPEQAVIKLFANGRYQPGSPGDKSASVELTTKTMP